jgi:hypothetical protein
MTPQSSRQRSAQAICYVAALYRCWDIMMATCKILDLMTCEFAHIFAAYYSTSLHHATTRHRCKDKIDLLQISKEQNYTKNHLVHPKPPLTIITNIDVLFYYLEPIHWFSLRQNLSLNFSFGSKLLFQEALKICIKILMSVN